MDESQVRFARRTTDYEEVDREELVIATWFSPRRRAGDYNIIAGWKVNEQGEITWRPKHVWAFNRCAARPIGE